LLLGSAAAAQSSSGSLQALIDELNRLIGSVGPVAGSVTEQLPADLQPEAANAERSAH
jgi:hypothetical protein